MIETSLAERLRRGAEQALAPTIAPRRRRMSPRRRAQARRVLAGARTRSQRDVLVSRAVTGYRRGPKTFWGPLLLELLAPKLTRKLARLSSVPPFVQPEDLAQLLVLELLQAASTFPLPADTRRWERSLRLEAVKQVTRSMKREGRRQLQTESLEALAEEEHDDKDESDDE